MHSLLYRNILQMIYKYKVIRLCNKKLLTTSGPHNRKTKIDLGPPLLVTPSSDLTGHTSWRGTSDQTAKTLVASAAIAATRKSMTKLNESERVEKLQPLLQAGWSLVPERDAISKEFEFPDFIRAFSFMTAVAMASEKTNHHPEWANVYNKVQVTMSTHDVGGLSDKDIKAAIFMDIESKRHL